MVGWLITLREIGVFDLLPYLYKGHSKKTFLLSNPTWASTVETLPALGSATTILLLCLVDKENKWICSASSNSSTDYLSVINLIPYQHHESLTSLVPCSFLIASVKLCASYTWDNSNYQCYEVNQQDSTLTWINKWIHVVYRVSPSHKPKWSGRFIVLWIKTSRAELVEQLR